MNTMFNRAKAAQYLDYLILTLIAAFCYKYISFYGRYFAETHVQFSFLSFPVFIGEFLLLGSLVLLSIRLWLVPIKLNRWHYLIMCYFCFIVAKAFWGYFHWGPLAFRDSALFYYFAFAVIAYVCYRTDYFNRFVILAIYGLLLWFYFLPRFNDFWLIGRLMMGLALSSCFPDRRIGWLMAAGILVCTPYYYVTETARTFILGNLIAIVFFLATTLALVPRKMRILALSIGAALFLGFVVYVFGFSDNVSAKTIFKWTQIKAIYDNLDQDIKAGEATYTPEPIKQIRLYNPDPPPGTVVPIESIDAYVSPNPKAAELAAAEAEKSKEVHAVHAITEAERIEQEKKSVESNKFGNAIFRLFMWHDVIHDLAAEKPLLGFDFGKPFRSKSLEIIRSAIGEWERDGWISMHNSFLNILYRSGLVGAGFISILVWMFCRLTVFFMRQKLFAGLAMCTLLLNWAVGANFAVVLELPYMAVPLWTLAGLTLAFAQSKGFGSVKS